MKSLWLFGLGLLYSASAAAQVADQLRGLEGYTIVHTGKVTGYIDDDGEEQDSYEGCDFDRKLIIDYEYVVTCQTYFYTYAYSPDIVLFSRGGTYKALVKDKVFSVSAN